MPVNSNKFKLSVSSDIKPSRFKVDLPNIQLNKERETENKNEAFKSFKKIISKMRLSVKGNNRNIFFKDKAAKKDDRLRKWTEKQMEKSERLAFYWIFKLLFLVFIRIFLFLKDIIYWLGWISLFFIRLIFLASISIVKFLLSKISILFFSIIRAPRDKVNHSLFKSKELIKPRTDKKNKNLKESEFDIEDNQFRDKIEENFSFKKTGYLKSAVVYALVLITLTFPIKTLTFFSGLNIEFRRGQVLGATESAISDMAEAVNFLFKSDYKSAQTSFTNASNNFLDANKEVSRINSLLLSLAGLFPSKELKLAGESKKILRAGELSAETGKNLAEAISGLEDWDGETKLTSQLEKAREQVFLASMNISELNKILAGINFAVIPAEYQKQFYQAREKLDEFTLVFNKFISLLDQANILLGAGISKRYLLVFQNNSELRASGGFIGSYALVDILDGKIKNIEAPGGGSYDLEAGMKVRIKAPEPLWLVNPLWHFWDANWWPDWPKSADKLAWFYEKSSGPTVDGVIGITPTVVERILELTGPIDMSETYGEIINSENFWSIVQRYSEQKPDITNKPEEIIADMLNMLTEELAERINRASILELLDLVEKSLSEKQLLLYFTDDGLEDAIKAYGWSGEVLNTNWDYLQVVHTNIAGGKSNRAIDEELSLITEIQFDGTIINTLRIKQTHAGAYGEEFTGVGNNDWLRVYVPFGSELLEATGFSVIDNKLFEIPDESWKTDEYIAEHEEKAYFHPGSSTKIYEEFNKTVFANWVQIKPGEVKTVIIKYKLPFKIKINQILDSEISDNILSPYALLVQKQPGAKESSFQSKLVISKDFYTIWNYPESLIMNESGWLINDELDGDKYWAVILKYSGND